MGNDKKVIIPRTYFGLQFSQILSTAGHLLIRIASLPHLDWKERQLPIC
jgi:hypothetical protein